MLSLDKSLAQLVNEGMIDVELARSRARVPEEFERLVDKRDKRGQF